jgi:broad specificity phosphatase PhoE
LTASAPKKSQPEPGPSPVTRLWFIRHAEVEPRYQHTFGGRIDMDILAGYLRDKPFDAAYASPMKRVQQTLAPVLKNGAPAPTILPGLREVDFGDWTGFNWEQVQEKFGVHPYDWLDEIELGAVPNGETGLQFRARVEPCLFEIIRRHPGGTVAVFCHGGVIRMMLAILLELPLPRTNSFEIEYASITRVLRRQHLNEIDLLNYTPWRDGPP